VSPLLRLPTVTDSYAEGLTALVDPNVYCCTLTTWAATLTRRSAKPSRKRKSGLDVAESSGHAWGYVICACGQRIPVYSTGRNPEFGAKLIRKFTTNHRDHEEPR
jgi:hypothetical protein